ncbi:MAG: RNA-binding protein [Kiritimatiellae bacterium]|nr:RNA-binding protein [Kiritimatiellia bacterium]
MVLYVGNLSYKVREGDLRRFFRKYGKVISARIIRNRFNGESKGYGFVEMGSRNEAQSAISELDGKAFRGRPIVVSEAKSAKEE